MARWIEVLEWRYNYRKNSNIFIDTLKRIGTRSPLSTKSWCRKDMSPNLRIPYM